MAKKKRKSYRRPTVRTDRIYERTSLACGKPPAGGTGPCRGNPNRS